MQENNISVTFYHGLRENDHIIDHLVQCDPPMAWTPAVVNVQSRNIRSFMHMANIMPENWRKYLIEKYDFDVLNPSEIGLLNTGVPKERIQQAMELAEEQKENWELEADINDIWFVDTDYPQNISPSQAYEVIAETGGRGTPVIGFRADESIIMAALSEDNMITLTPGQHSVFVGLSDPINGISWSPEGLTGEIKFRPSQNGVTILGDDSLFQDVVDDAYTVSLTYEAGEPLMMSSRSEETSRLAPPPVRDERPLSQITSVGM